MLGHVDWATWILDSPHNISQHATAFRGGEFCYDRDLLAWRGGQHFDCNPKRTQNIPLFA